MPIFKKGHFIVISGMETFLKFPVIKQLRSLNFDQELFLVGGALRDIFLSYKNQGLMCRDLKDIDLTTGGDVKKYARMFASAFGGTLVPLDVERNVYRVISRNSCGNGPGVIDFAGFKGPGLIDDLKARDFTINAMAMDLLSDNPVLIDPLNGKKDIEKGIIKECSPSSIPDDPLRIMRAYRMKSIYGFKMETRLVARCIKYSYRLVSCAPERKRDELFLILREQNAYPVICEMAKDGILEEIFPQIKLMKKTKQNAFHHLNVWEHSLESLKFLEIFLNDINMISTEYASFMENALTGDMIDGRSIKSLLKLTTIFHDIGKPSTASVKSDKEISFWEHDKKGAKDSVLISMALSLSQKEETFIQNMIKNHMRPLHLLKLNKISKRASFRLLRDCEEFLVPLLLLSVADISATRGPKADKNAFGAMLSLIDSLLSLLHDDYLPVIKGKPLLTGHDIMSGFNLQPGKKIGRLLKQLHMAQFMGNVKTRDDALSFVSSCISKEP